MSWYRLFYLNNSCICSLIFHPGNYTNNYSIQLSKLNGTYLLACRRIWKKTYTEGYNCMKRNVCLLHVHVVWWIYFCCILRAESFQAKYATGWLDMYNVLELYWHVPNHVTYHFYVEVEPCVINKSTPTWFGHAFGITCKDYSIAASTYWYLHVPCFIARILDHFCSNAEKNKMAAVFAIRWFLAAWRQKRVCGQRSFGRLHRDDGFTTTTANGSVTNTYLMIIKVDALKHQH